MIPYVNILDKYSFLPKALVEPSQCWFEISYYENGEFEIYAPATEKNIDSLKRGNFVTIPHRKYIWIIVSVQYEFNSDGARMIDVKGFEAKHLLSKRIIYTPELIQGSLDTEVCRIVNFALGTGANSYRKIKGFKALNSNIEETLLPTQATRGNLLDFTLSLIKSYKVGAETLYEDGNIVFQLKKGRDLSDSILFSQSMDNLISSTYFESDANEKTYCQIVSTFKEKTNTTEFVKQYPVSDPSVSGQPKANVGIDRSEISLESNISNKYTDENGTEITLDLTKNADKQKYEEFLVEAGKTALSEHLLDVEFNGEIDLQHSIYKFGEDFDIGDLIKVRDEIFGYEAKARILKYTFKQDASGYGEECEYGNE